MSYRLCLAALALALGLAQHAPASADQWVPVTTSLDKSQFYDVDVESVTQTGGFVHSWARTVTPKGQRLPSGGKTYVTALSERYDDCLSRRFRFDKVIMRNSKGRVVENMQFPLVWQPVVPGSANEAVAKTICRIASPPKDQPWVKDITTGAWTALGPSKDGKYNMSVMLDQVVKVREGFVLVLSRTDVVEYQFFEELPVKYLVEASLVDCQNAKQVSAGIDYYMTPQVRALSTRPDPDGQPRFLPVEPGSFLFNHLRQICAAGVAAAASEEDDEEGGVGSGTAWGVNKGYLITASHVVTGAKTITVYREGQVYGEAEVVADDPANDLAVLKLAKAPPQKLDILLISDKGAGLGRSVFTLGYPQPGVMGQRVKMTAGEVSATAGLQDDARFLQISVPIQQGNSGGPLIGWDGTVLGVVEAKLTRFDEEAKGPAPENVNYAVKSAYVRPMLDDLPDLGNYVAVRPAANPDALVAAARKAVFMLVVTK
jgi:S1-C subfamily serine protease